LSKVNILQLRKAIGREEFDHTLLSSALSSYLAVDQKINELLKSGTIDRVKKGLYVFGPESRQAPICKESLANLIYGPSCISMEYALSFHGLIPERVETITSVTPKRDKEFNTPVGRFTYRYLNAAKYPHGIEQQWIDKLHPILIASPEKALCDYVVLNDVPEFTITSSAKAFLLQDLRIGQESWARFDVKKLLRLNAHYNSQNIARILEVL
jgi:predicted transcriptional regulator of viral defense system